MLWDTATGQARRSFVGHTSDVLSVAFSSDGSHVLSAGNNDGMRGVSGNKHADPSVKLWNSATGRLLRTFELSDYATSVALSPDGKRVLAAQGSPNVLLWDAATGALLRQFQTGSKVVNSVAFSPDGQRIVTAGYETLRLWDAASGALVRAFEGGSFRDVAFSPDGTRIASGGLPGLTLWDAATGTLVRSFSGSLTSESISFSPDGARIVSKRVGAIELWDVASGKLLRAIDERDCERVAFSPDGARLLSGSSDGLVKVWKADTAELLATLIHGRDGEWIAFTPEGFFDASKNGARLLSVVRGLEVLSSGRLRRPDLVREKLAGDASGKVKAEAAKLTFN